MFQGRVQVRGPDGVFDLAQFLFGQPGGAGGHGHGFSGFAVAALVPAPHGQDGNSPAARSCADPAGGPHRHHLLLTARVRGRGAGIRLCRGARTGGGLGRTGGGRGGGFGCRFRLPVVSSGGGVRCGLEGLLGWSGGPGAGDVPSGGGDGESGAGDDQVRVGDGVLVGLGKVGVAVRVPEGLQRDAGERVPGFDDVGGGAGLRGRARRGRHQAGGGASSRVRSSVRG